jgi:hypothetical protein
MTKVFRYSRVYYLGLLFFCIPSFFLVKGFLYEAFPIENYAYSIILVVLVILIITGPIHYWQNTAVKIITDTNTIEIRKPFNSVKWRWEEVSEFGKYRRIAPYVGGYWVYYIRGGLRNRKSVLGVIGLKKLEDLVPYILFKAYKAKVVNIQKADKITN